MASGVRAGTVGRASALRQPTRSSSARIPTLSQAASRIDRAGAASPAESIMSTATTMTAGTKRKEREFEADVGVNVAGEETNINVVVRCRGRNEREIKENSAMVVNTDGVKGKLVELFLGASALSNKTYNFDRVYSPAADQSMVFDDTVKPILDEVCLAIVLSSDAFNCGEMRAAPPLPPLSPQTLLTRDDDKMLAGYNCTIFAYGQTGTGKTYTMSGDMTDTLGMLSDEAGIIPRVLQQLFNKLEVDDREHAVKCSFIELYNEELRDLLSVEETAKLKIYDDASRRGHSSTIVQGMEEKHIKTAAEGIKVLQGGSLKRQVAATKCNDLSSRSHTVFTITAYVKRTNQDGVDDFVSAGKLNLVDLAGSENIQRSGAENKRAAEAGLINKSLLTLGRVINALVDHSSHIPYRESKLTRLLQDSLGGRTKTCIIATISPAKSNMEETISTLEYAFRAKNIKNKPQLNGIDKKTLLKDFTSEIEKLKAELISARQRNGVYLSNETYEEMTAQSESRRIVVDEQAAKIEALESNLRNKVQEFFTLTTNFMGLKKDFEGTKVQLDETKGVLDQTELVLSATRKMLSDETHLRQAHEETEQKLAEIGGELISKLHRTTKDVNGLHAKNKRKSDLQSLNRATWGTSQSQVADVTSMVERRIREFEEEQREQISSVSRRMEAFVSEELQKLSTTQTFLDEHLGVFLESKKQLLDQKQKSKEDMDEVLEEIKVIRDTVKDRVGQSLNVISQAAEKIAADVLSEMTNFHNQLHTSYSSIGKDFKSVFEDLVRQMTSQRTESDSLRRQLQTATSTIALQNNGISSRMQEALEEERRQAADDRQKLLTQISNLINAQAEAQEARLAERTAQVQKGIQESTTSLEGAVATFGEGMVTWDDRQGQLLDEVKKSRDQLKTKMKDDWAAANDQSTAIQNTAKSAHVEMTRAVDEQVEDLDIQMKALDDFVTRARSENNSHHESQGQYVQALSNTVEQSFGNISAHFKTTFDRVQNLGDEMESDVNDLQDGLEPLDSQLCQPLANLREGVSSTALHEYQPTGETPQKVQYQYPTTLPRTRGRTNTTLSSATAEEKDEMESMAGDDAGATEKDETLVFADLDQIKHEELSSPPLLRSSIGGALNRSNSSGTLSAMSLREVNPNVTASNGAAVAGFDPRASTISMPAEHTMPLFKRSSRVTRGMKKQSLGMVVEGRENLPLTALDEDISRRKSPRLN